jgi:hypothetical protein
MYWQAEVAHHLGLVPLAWLAIKRVRDTAYWWLGMAFGVSWIADTLAHFMGQSRVSLAYPVSQAALIGAVFLTRKDAWQLVGILLSAAIAALLFSGWDLLLHTIAWGSIVGIMWDKWQLGHLRTSLLVTFGLGLLAWWGYVAHPGWTTWLLFQSCRLVGTLVFCYAVVNDRPLLKVV